MIHNMFSLLIMWHTTNQLGFQQEAQEQLHSADRIAFNKNGVVALQQLVSESNFKKFILVRLENLICFLSWSPFQADAAFFLP